LKTYDIEGLGKVYRLEPGDDARGVEELLRSDKGIAYDTETSCLDVYLPGFEHKLSQFGSRDLAFTWDPDELSLDRLVTTKRPVWYFNADFDTRVLDHVRDITLEETWPFVKDAAILARLIDSRNAKQGGFGHSLEEQSSARLGLGAKDATKKALLLAGEKYGLQSEEAMWRGIPRTDDDYNRYAGQDVMTTVRLGEHLLEGIEYYDLEEIASLEHSVGYCVATIERRGWKVDRAYGEEAIARFEQIFAEEDAKLAEWGVRPTKSSGRHVTSRMGLIDRFQELGVTFTEPSKSAAEKLKAGTWQDADVIEAKAWKLDEGVLLSIASKKKDLAADLARAVLTAKKPERAATTIRGYLRYADENDRVHAGINPLGTVTGRMSSSAPTLQNPSRDIEEVRGTFVAEKGYSLLSVDYSSVEWRVAAGVTDDEGLRTAFATGKDPHKISAELIYGDAWRNGTEEERKDLKQKAKTRGLGKLYGQYYKNAAKQEGIPEEDMKAVHDALDELYPGIKRKVDEYRDIINGPTRVDLETGRSVYVDRPHKVLNYLCQGPARDLLAYAVLRMFEAGLGEYIRMLVHDEVVLEVPELEAEAYKEKVMEIMESEFLGVKITSDGNVLGERWKKA
jgi:DNA polymerase-1